GAIPRLGHGRDSVPVRGPNVTHPHRPLSPPTGRLPNSLTHSLDLLLGGKVRHEPPGRVAVLPRHQVPDGILHLAPGYESGRLRVGVVERDVVRLGQPRRYALRPGRPAPPLALPLDGQ